MTRQVEPAYLRIKQTLLQEIEQGEYIPNRAFVTHQEVCQRFQVSRITAERAINELVREGVLMRIRGRGTFVAEPSTSTPAHLAIPVLQAKQSGLRTIGCVMSYIRGGHALEVIRGIERVCREANYTFLLFDSDENLEIEAQNLQRAQQARVDGLIVYPVDSHINAPHFEKIIEAGLPLVMVDRYYPALSTDIISADNVSAGYQLTTYLIGQGHRRIALLWSETAATSVQERLIGYQQAIRESGFPLDTSLAAVLPYGRASEQERLILLQHLLELSDPMTAIIAANGSLLSRITEDLATLKVQAGEQIILASMDNYDPEAAWAPTEAVILLPSTQIGLEAAQLLIQRINTPGNSAREHHMLPVKLLIGRPSSKSSHTILSS